MKTEIKKIFQCDHCSKWYHVRAACEKHENNCTSNPVNKRPCFGCVGLKKKEVEVYPVVGDTRQVASLLYCDKKEMFLHTPVNENKGNQFEIADHDNNPMPKECEEHEDFFEMPEGIKAMFKK